MAEVPVSRLTEGNVLLLKACDVNIANNANFRSFHKHPDGSPVNSAICEEICKFWLDLTMVVYEKIFGSINK